MDYKFKYKSEFDKKNLSQQINKILSDSLFFLYDNWLFKKLKLDKNEFLKSHIPFGNKRIVPRVFETDIPDDFNLKIYSFTFLDCIEIEDGNKLKDRLIKIISKYKGGFLSDEPEKKLKKAFRNFDQSYNTCAWGTLFFNNVKGDSELDLINGISYGYIKGSKSHLILTYTIFPSETFHRLFKESLNIGTTEESEISFNSPKVIFRTNRLLSSIGYNIKEPHYWTNKLLNEISFQFQSRVISPLKLGMFNTAKKVLLPGILSIEYDPDQFSLYQNRIFTILDIDRHQHFESENIIFTLKNIDFSKSPSTNIEIFIPKRSTQSNVENELESIDYLSKNFITAISPYWLLINVCSINKLSLIYLRRITSIYIRKNKITLFLKTILKLKNKLSLAWINFERIRKDFSTEIFKDQLRFHKVPDALSAPWFKGGDHEEFKKNLIRFSENSAKEIKGSYEELLELFSHIGEDNLMRANMRLQRILFLFAILGVLLAVYSANSNYFNSWIVFFLNNCGIEIPRVK
jgi:hypothetical protein